VIPTVEASDLAAVRSIAGEHLTNRGKDAAIFRFGDQERIGPCQTFTEGQIHEQEGLVL